MAKVGRMSVSNVLVTGLQVSAYGKQCPSCIIAEHNQSYG